MAGAWRILERDSVGSTNDEARALAQAGDPGRVAVVARRQTAGRGRLGRPWVSEPGGLYLSALLRPALPAARAGLLPLAAGVAVAEAAERLGARPELRWPNDVLVGGRKLAGVLCEARFAPGAAALEWVVIGVGLNVQQRGPTLLAAGGTSLAQLGIATDPAALRGPLLARLDAAVAQAQGSPDTLLAAWMRRSPMLGKPVQVMTHAGPVGGSAERVSSEGALIVRTTDGLREIHDPDLVRVEL